MDSRRGHRNTNPPGFSRAPTSPRTWDQFSHNGLPDSGQFPTQMSYSSQPVEADAFIARNLGTRSLGTTYNSTSPGIPEQRTLQKWSSTPTNPPQMSVGVSSTIPYTHTLASYVSNPEDPWSQKGFFAGPSTSDGRLQPNSQPSGQLPVNQNPYGIREGGVILDKPQSDSGYGSLQSAYASSISNFDIGIQATGTRISFPPSHGFQQTEPKVASSGVSISAPPLLHCPTCGKVVKTPSALRKHDQRHKKPFICSYPNCLGSGKGLGFGTINDLERHIKSKHREGEVFGRPVQLFSCHFRECQEKDRKFTRSDNYGVHLQRCHGMKKDMIRGLIQRKKEQHRLGNSRIQPGDRPQGRSYDIQMQDLSQEISYSMEQSNESLVADESHYDMYDHDDQGPGPEDMTFYMATDQSQEYKATHVLEETKYKPAGALDMEYLSGMDPVDTFEPVDFIMDPTLDISESATPVVTTIGITLKRESGADIRASTDPQAQKTLASIFAKRRSQDVKKSRGTSQSSVAPRDISTLLSRIKPISEELNPGDLPADDSKEEDCHTDSQDDDNAATILRDMKSRGYVLRRDKGHFPEPHKPSPPSPSTHSQPGLSCSFCPKTCKRPSEMAKHMKRHTRPYSCTFPLCTKTFGSKNDWRRHENSQHLHYESWRCSAIHPSTSSTPSLQTHDHDATTDSASACKHISYHLDAFRSHLSRTHQVPNDEINDRANRAHTLAAAPRTFHCSFCARDIPQIGGWGSRFDHLDAHFRERAGEGKVEVGAWATQGQLPKDEGGGES